MLHASLMRLGRTLAIGALVCPAMAQEVLVPELFGGQPHPTDVAVVGSDLWFVWSADSEFCGGPMLAMRRFDGAGRPLGPDVQVWAQCATMATDSARIVASPTGGFLVAGPSAQGITARLFDAAGTPTTGDIQVSTMGSWTVEATALPTGDYAVVYGAGWFDAVAGRIVKSDGSMPSPERTLAAPTSALFPFEPTIASFGTGDIVVSWTWDNLEGGDGQVLYVVGRLFDSDLLPLGAEFMISECSQSGCMRAANGTIVARGNRLLATFDSTEMYARWFDEHAVALGPPQPIGAQGRLPVATLDAAGGSVITWDSPSGIRGRRFAANGSPLGPDFPISMTSAWTMWPRVAWSPDDGFVTVFGTNVPTAQGALLRRFMFPPSIGVAPGPGAANPAELRQMRPDGRQVGAAVVPYGTGRYGATVGAGQIDATPLHEMLSGPGPSPFFGPHVRAFRADGTSVAKVSFYAYGTLKYGVEEAGADVDLDGHDEILTGPGPGPVFGPHVRGFDYDGAVLRPAPGASFYAMSTLKYGVNVAGGDMDADGRGEILAGAGPSPAFAPQVRGFRYDGTAIAAVPGLDFWAYPTGTHGARVSAVDVDSDGAGGFGDGTDEIVTGPGPGAMNAAELRLFDYAAGTVAFRHAETAYATTMYGVVPAGGDVDAGDTGEVVTAPGPDPAAPVVIRAWEWNPLLGGNGGPTFEIIGTDDFTAFPGLGFGGRVAVGTFE